MNELNISVLTGDTITKLDGAKEGSGLIIFHMKSGKRYRMFHVQDCCESVYIEQIHGNPESLVGKEVIWASENSNRGESEGDSKTWTYYTISTENGPVSFRWMGESNGYYSESVSFVDDIEYSN